MFLFRSLFGLCVIAALPLAATNPSLDDGLQEVDRRIKAEQSTVRASWDGVTKFTGIDWLGKQAGLGNLELCRKSIYVASLYTVRDVSGKDPEDQLAVGFGVGGKIWGEKLMESGEISSRVLNGIARPLASSVDFTECKVFKKAGKLF